MQTTKHAIAAGMGAPVRLCSETYSDPVALQDFTPEAGLDALSLTIEETALSMAQLRAGRLAQAVDACQRARKALDAACVSLTYLSGGLPR